MSDEFASGTSSFEEGDNSEIDNAPKGGRWSPSVGQKLMGVVAICLGLLVATAGSGLYQLNNIGGEIEAIAEQDMPLTEIITKITVHQLEQAIEFERAIRYGEEMQGDEAQREPFQHAIDEFEKLGHKVAAETKEGEKLAEEAVATAHTAEEKAEFEKVLHSLEAIDTAHVSYEKHSMEVFEAFAAHETEHALEVAH